jgi:hypothetical protein
MYSSRAWLKVKEHWISLRLGCQSPRCLHPGVPIDYTKPRTKRTSFNCGHIVPVWWAEQHGWTTEQIWSLANSRPEHRACNVSDGARMGQRRQQAKLTQVTVLLAESRRW